MLTMSSEPSAFLTSQVQPEPKLPTAEAWKALANSANDPHLASIAAASAPAGAPPPFGCQAIPEEAVVPHLRRVVVDAAGRCLADDRFEVERFVFGPLDQVVEVGDVGLMVLAVMVFEGFLRHVRRQGVDGKGQLRQLMFHGCSP
jgi:hypothetical protein